MVMMPKPKPATHDYKGGRYRIENANYRPTSQGLQPGVGPQSYDGTLYEKRVQRGICIECGSPKSAHFMEE